MELLHGYEQFRDLYQKIRQRSEKICSNCLLPQKTIAEALNDSEMYWEEYPQGLVLFTRHQAPEQYLKLYFFLRDISVFPDISADCPLILEELDAGGKREDYIRTITGSLQKAGFTKAAENHMFERSLEDPFLSSELNKRIASLSAEGCRIVMDPVDVDLSEITSLWKKYLKPSDIPSDHLSAPVSENAHIVCVLDRENSVCGANWWECRGKVCEIRHTVTRSDIRRRQIGSTMILFAAEQARTGLCRTAYTYIEEKNTASMNMYERIGFRKNGKICVQFTRPVSGSDHGSDGQLHK
ncbi:MAG: GNAT family N-acetyltransferase [Flexilinea sp.]|nr:GNAT family N-acetyltransferase [Flexilinea sp.]